MVAIYFTNVLFPSSNGKSKSKLYVKPCSPTRTDSPGDERRASKEAVSAIYTALGVSEKNPSVDDSVVFGDIPDTALPFFVFGIAVSWDREHMMSHYTDIGYHKTINSKALSSAYPEAMSLRSEIFGVFRRYEAKIRKEKGAPKFCPDRLSIARVNEDFEKYKTDVMQGYIKRVLAEDIRKKSASCGRCKGKRFCSPANRTCEHYLENGGLCAVSLLDDK